VGFSGFPAEAVTFYEGLAADNSRAWWLAHKADYDQFVRGPMEALLDELHAFGPFHVFRPNRDVRFAKDKTPYKDHVAAYGENEGGTGLYVHFSAGGLLAGSGYYHMASDQLERFRRAVDDERLGPQIEAIVGELTRDGLRASAMDELKTAPRGYAKDHPRIELLRRKGLVVSREWPLAKWMQTKAVVGRVRDAWAAAVPMNEWLDAHVGPSTLPPDEGPGWRR
jgi:uncharacterized protein (TIGR02453 family)